MLLDSSFIGCLLFLFQLKTAREAVNFGLTGSVIGAVSTAGVAWKYSRSLHGIQLTCLSI